MVALQNPVLEQVIQSLGFKDSETFLKIQAQSLLLQKIAYYRGRIDLFIKKYDGDYDSFMNRFNDVSQSLIEKENVWLLCSNDCIVWVIGHRGDELAKVTKDTKNILKITLNK